MASSGGTDLIIEGFWWESEWGKTQFSLRVWILGV